MPILLRAGTPRAKPPPGTGINWAHPSAPGLVAAFFLNERGGLKVHSALDGATGALTNGPTWATAGADNAGSQGLAFVSASSQYVLLDQDLTTRFSGPAGTVALGVYLASNNTKGLFAKIGQGDDSGTGSGWGIGVGNDADADHTGNTLEGLAEDVAWYNTAATIGTGWHHLALTVGPGATSAIAMYLDGRQVFTTSTASVRTPTARIYLGGYDATHLRYSDATIDHAYIWNRPLTRAEINQLAHDPYGLALPRAARLWVPGPAVAAVPRPPTIVTSQATRRAAVW